MYVTELPTVSVVVESSGLRKIWLSIETTPLSRVVAEILRQFACETFSDAYFH